MYVCLCNGITEQDAERAVAAGARKPAQVHAAHGARPQCGRCSAALRELLGRTTTEGDTHLSHPAHKLA